MGQRKAAFLEGGFFTLFLTYLFAETSTNDSPILGYEYFPAT